MLQLLAGLLAAYLLGCTFLAYKYLHPRREVSETVPTVRLVKVPTTAGDNPTWITPDFETARVIFVLSYGYQGTRGAWLPLIAALKSHHFAAVVPAMPGQEDSPIETVGFGVTEASLILTTVDWVRKKRPDHPKIILLGVSMGGAATWLAAQDDPSIDGVVTEGAYARFTDAISSYFNRSGPATPILLAPVVWIASQMGGMHPEEIKPVEAAAAWKGRPALVIQGADDQTILRTQAEALVAASGADYWLVPGAGHAQCFETDPVGYIDHLVAFVKRLP